MTLVQRSSSQPGFSAALPTSLLCTGATHHMLVISVKQATEYFELCSEIFRMKALNSAQKHWCKKQAF